MKNHFTLLLLCISLMGKSQLKVVAESPVFEEPENGEVLLVNMKDGASAYVHLTAKSGLSLRIFDAQHKQTLATKLEPDYGRLKGMSFKGAWELNNELTLFISEVEDKEPVLYRLRIDKQNGKLKELKTLAALKAINLGQGYAMAFGKAVAPDFLVRKDLSSDHYAVARFNSFESERDKRVELIQYTPDGTEKGRVFLSSPGDKYKYTEIFDVLVDGDVAYALLFSYNTPASGGAANELLLATVRNNEVSYSNVGQAIKRRINSGSLHKNPSTGNILFVAKEHLSTTRAGWQKFRENYAVSINNLNLSTGEVSRAVELQTSGLVPKYRKLYKTEKDLVLGFDQLVQNHDGTFTIMMEYIKEVVSTSRGMSGIPLSSSVNTRSQVSLGPSGILTYDGDGKELEIALVPKSYSLMVRSGAPPVAGDIVMNAGNQFKGASFAKMKNKSYAFINDIEENEERIQKGKITTIAGVGECEAWQYDLSTQVSAALPMPQRSKIFPPAGKKEKNLMMVGVSQLDYERNILMTLKVNKNGASVVWLTE